MELNKWQSQVRKGTLEFLLLLLLGKNEYYGYELIKKIRDTAFLDMSEGTIYPILNRLKKANLVSSRWNEPETGIPRKYYRITDEGKRVLEQMKKSWTFLTSSIQNIIDHQ